MWLSMEAWQDARTPALAIVARGDQIEALSPGEFKVASQSHPGVSYKVSLSRGRWSCECPFHSETKVACIHILAVRFRSGFKGSNVPEPETAAPCARCGSGDVESGGYRANKSGRVRRFHCRVCGTFYSGREGYHRRRADPEMIAKALDLYFRGVSLRQVAAHFGQAYGLKLSPMTVYRWVTHYSRLAAEWMDSQKAKVGTTWHADERFLNVNGDRAYLWNVMDSETRFLLSSRVSKGRGIVDARAALHHAKDVAEGKPTEVRTDGLWAYGPAIHKEFGSNYGPGGKSHSPHRVVPSIRAPLSNNRIERMNGSQKDRTKTMRAYDNLPGSAALSEGWRVHYNLIRSHLALGTTPGVAAGLPAISGWRELIDLASRKVTEDRKWPC